MHVRVECLKDSEKFKIGEIALMSEKDAKFYEEQGLVKILERVKEKNVEVLKAESPTPVKPIEAKPIDMSVVGIKEKKEEPIPIKEIDPIDKDVTPLRWAFHDGRVFVKVVPYNARTFELDVSFDGKALYEPMKIALNLSDKTVEILKNRLQSKKLGDFALADHHVHGMVMYLQRIVDDLRKKGLAKSVKSKYNLKKAYTNEDILQSLLLQNDDEASEALVMRVLGKLYIYTTADDVRPEMWVYEDGIYRPNGKSKIKEELRNVLGMAYNMRIANMVVEKIQADTFIDPEIFFNSEIGELVVVENGLLDPTTKMITPHTPEMVHFSKLPVVYDTSKDCPNIKQHFKTILKNEEDLTIIQEVFGFFLFNEYRYEKAIMMNGDGRNGKGKTIGLAKIFLGPDSFVSVPLQELEEDQYSVEQLMNKRANLAGDLNPTALKNTGKFKQLTGRDPISGNRKYKTRIQFENNAKLIFACNELPKTFDLTPAFFDRWILLDFPYTFLPENEYNALKEDERKGCKVADPEIIKKLTTPEELSGLLNFALEGYDRLGKNGGFSWCKSIEEVKMMWIRKSDSFAAFCIDEVDEDSEARIVKSVLVKAYIDYCRVNRLRKLGDRLIKNFLIENFGVDEDRTTIFGRQEHVWTGIKLRVKDEAVTPNNSISQGCHDCHPFLQNVSRARGGEFITTGSNSGNPGKLVVEEIKIGVTEAEKKRRIELNYALLDAITENLDKDEVAYEMDIILTMREKFGQIDEEILQIIKEHLKNGDITEQEPRNYRIIKKW